MKEIYSAPVMKIVVIEEEGQLLTKSGVFSEDHEIDWGGFDDGSEDPD